MNINFVTLISAIAWLTSTLAFAAQPVANEPPDIERGRLLYENQCGDCHQAHLHMRDQPRARSLAEVHAQVARWSGAGRTEWTQDELNDVTAWLNSEYYHYPCADLICSAEAQR